MAGKGSVIIVGVGPGLGASVARRFAKEGHPVAVAARSQDKVDAITGEVSGLGVKALGVAIDGTDEAAVTEFVARTEDELGPLDVAVYNASGRAIKGILDLTAHDMEDSWRKSCLGGFFLGREAARRMLPRGHGTILMTGATAAMRGGKNFAAFAVGKFGLRALAQSMAREFGPQGIHVAHINIDGGIMSERVKDMVKDRPADSFLEPDAIADAYYGLHMQHRSAWSQEVDLRPWAEKF